METAKSQHRDFRGGMAHLLPQFAFGVVLLASLWPLKPFAACQEKETIRHHRVIDPDASASAELTDAESAIEKHDYSQAEGLLEKIVSKDEGNYQAWFDLGFVRHALGNNESAAAAYRKSVAAKPDVFESNLNLGLSLAQLHQPDAEQFLRAATGLKPVSNVQENMTRAWLALGHLFETTDPAQAVEAYRKAEEFQPDDAQIHRSTALVLEKQNRSGEAEQELQKALALDPTSAEIVGDLVRLYVQRHDLPDAEIILRKAIGARPAEGQLHRELGQLLEEQNQNDQAIAEFEIAAKLSPASFDIRRELAGLYETTGRLQEASAAYSLLLTQAPNDAGLHRRLGNILLTQRKFPEAQEQFILAVKLKPDLGPAYGDLAIAANETHDWPLVVRALDERAKYLPDIPICFFLRATAYDHLRDVKQAVLNYHEFLKAAKGALPEQEWQASHRLLALEKK